MATRTATIPNPAETSHREAQIRELRIAKLAIARRMTGAGYALADAVIDSHFARRRGLTPETARTIRCSREIAAIDEAIRTLEASA